VTIPQLAFSIFVLALGSLAVLVLLTAGVPRVVLYFQKRMQPATPLNTTPLVRENVELDDRTLAAIAFVVHAEADRLKGPNMKVTLPLNPSPWALSSQMRVLPGRISNS
jgi:hypothetical protein